MELPRQSEIFVELADALNDLRDSLVRVATFLRDHIADNPSPEQHEEMLHVERALKRIRDAGTD
jgi:hypothetical protein